MNAFDQSYWISLHEISFISVFISDVLHFNHQNVNSYNIKDQKKLLHSVPR